MRFLRKSPFLLSLTLPLLVVALSGCGVFFLLGAPDDLPEQAPLTAETEAVQFTTLEADMGVGNFNIDHPVDWGAVVDNNIIVLANSQAYLDTLLETQSFAIEEGELVMTIFPGTTGNTSNIDNIRSLVEEFYSLTLEAPEIAEYDSRPVEIYTGTRIAEGFSHTYTIVLIADDRGDIALVANYIGDFDAIIREIAQTAVWG